jgi:hypothetical protein
MTTATIPSDVNPQHIGPAHHPARTAGIIGGLVVLAGVIASFYVYSSRHGAPAMERLAEFQALYAQHCDVKYSADTSKMVQRFYADSKQMQSVVDQQLDALSNGAACDTVTSALRAADYPVPTGTSSVASPPAAAQ